MQNSVQIAENKFKVIDLHILTLIYHWFNLQKLLGIFAISLCVLSSIDAYNVLVLLPFPGPSHFLMFKVFIQELIDRGHHVTAITAFQYKEKLANYTEILIDPVWSFGDDCKLVYDRKRRKSAH